MSEIWKGAPVVEALREKTASICTELGERGITPTLAIVRVGEKSEDLSYERGAMKRCAAAGVAVRSVVFPADCSQQEVCDALLDLNEDASVHGILLFRPLPKTMDEEVICRCIAPEKDVDGIRDLSLAGVFTGSGTGFAPCTARAVVELLHHYGVESSGKHAVVLGRSLVIGKPVSMLLLNENATVTLCHSRSTQAAELARTADILVAAIGKMEYVGREYMHPGQIVIDVGIHWSDEKQKLCGDVRFEEAEGSVSAITPVPGGVGGITSAVLALHTAEAAQRQNL